MPAVESLDSLINCYERLLDGRRQLELLTVQLKTKREAVAESYGIPTPTKPQPVTATASGEGDTSPGLEKEECSTVHTDTEPIRASQCPNVCVLQNGKEPSLSALKKLQHKMTAKIATLEQHIAGQQRRSSAIQFALQEYNSAEARLFAKKLEDKYKTLRDINQRITQDITSYRHQLIKQLLRVFHIRLEDPTPSIRGFPILSTQDYVNRMDTMAASELWILGTSLGFLAHLTQLFARYLDIPLSKRLVLRSSRSFILECTPTACVAVSYLRGRIPHWTNDGSEHSMPTRGSEKTESTPTECTTGLRSLLEPLPVGYQIPQALRPLVAMLTDHKGLAGCVDGATEFTVGIRQRSFKCKQEPLPSGGPPVTHGLLSNNGGRALAATGIYRTTAGIEYYDASMALSLGRQKEPCCAVTSPSTIPSPPTDKTQLRTKSPSNQSTFPPSPYSTSSFSNFQPWISSPDTRSASDTLGLTLSLFGFNGRTDKQQFSRAELTQYYSKGWSATDNPAEGLPLYVNSTSGVGRVQFALAVTALQDMIEQLAWVYEASYKIPTRPGKKLMDTECTGLTAATNHGSPHFGKTQNIPTGKSPPPGKKQTSLSKQSLFEPLRRVFALELRKKIEATAYVST